MARKSDHDGLRLDEAARAGWLYYVAGNTQDEIARKLGISRQAAQRLVSLAISERLIKVRLDHPIARCMELAAALKLRYDLQVLRGRADRSGLDLVDARHRSGRRGGIRTLAAPLGARDHRHRHRPHDARRRRSVAGDGMPAAQAGRAGRHHQDRRLGFVLRRHHPRVRQRARAALSDAAAGHRSLGRGARTPDQPRLGEESVRPRRADRRQFRRRRRGRRFAPLVQDGIITRQEAEALRHLGAVGEITGWAFDAAGKVLAEGSNQRVAGRAAQARRQPARDRRRDGAVAARAAARRRSPGGSFPAWSPTKRRPSICCSGEQIGRKRVKYQRLVQSTRRFCAAAATNSD